VQSDALALLEARESRLVVSDHIKVEREAAIVTRIVERELVPDARRRWARRLDEMAFVFDATARPEPAGLARAAAAALADETREVAHQPFATGLARRALEIAGEVAAGRLRAADVPGGRVGHATDAAGLTGVTVVLCDRPAVGGVELRGGANDVLGLDYLDPRHLVPTVQGVVLGGGSRFGGETVWGVMRWLEERGAGFAVGPTVVPHVPGAFIFDLSVGDPKARPTREMGYAA